MNTLFNKAQFIRVFEMQNAMNIIATGDINWSENPMLQWDLAVIKETSEALDHLGWEWWKAVNVNTEQAKLELVDIIHFAVSGCLTTAKEKSLEEIWTEYEAELGTMDEFTKAQLSQWTTFDYLREIVTTAIMRNYGFTIYLAIRAAETLGMTPTQVFEGYVAKNMLNRFRKANGYKEGTYIKTWHGREDNEHLSDFLAVVDPSRPDFEEAIQSHLNALYKTVVSEQSVQ